MRCNIVRTAPDWWVLCDVVRGADTPAGAESLLGEDARVRPGELEKVSLGQIRLL